jgi:hypothetical protein
VSRHVVTDGQYKYVFGWDQLLQSFYLQKHDYSKDVDEQVEVWLGGDKDTIMYEVENLVYAAQRHGLRIGYNMRVKLYGEKDSGV